MHLFFLWKLQSSLSNWRNGSRPSSGPKLVVWMFYRARARMCELGLDVGQTAFPLLAGPWWPDQHRPLRNFTSMAVK